MSSGRVITNMNPDELWDSHEVSFDGSHLERISWMFAIITDGNNETSSCRVNFDFAENSALRSLTFPDEKTTHFNWHRMHTAETNDIVARYRLCGFCRANRSKRERNLVLKLITRWNSVKVSARRRRPTVNKRRTFFPRFSRRTYIISDNYLIWFDPMRKKKKTNILIRWEELYFF